MEITSLRCFPQKSLKILRFRTDLQQIWNASFSHVRGYKWASRGECGKSCLHLALKETSFMALRTVTAVHFKSDSDSLVSITIKLEPASFRSECRVQGYLVKFFPQIWLRQPRAILVRLPHPASVSRPTWCSGRPYIWRKCICSETVKRIPNISSTNSHTNCMRWFSSRSTAYSYWSSSSLPHSSNIHSSPIYSFVLLYP